MRAQDGRDAPSRALAKSGAAAALKLFLSQFFRCEFFPYGVGELINAGVAPIRKARTTTTTPRTAASAIFSFLFNLPDPFHHSGTARVVLLK